LQSLAFSPDGGRIVTGGQDNMLKLWDADTLSPIAGARFEGQAPDPGDGRLDVAFNASGDRILSIHTSADSDGRAVRVWDTGLQPVGIPIRSKEGKYGIDSVAFSPDGASMAWGLVNGDIQRWDTLSGKRIGAALKGHERQSNVQSLVFSPDGEYLVSAGYDGTLRLWTGRAIGGPFRGPTGEGGVRSVAFSSDGARIVSGDVDGTVRLWPGPSAWAGLLCAKLTRNMSRTQWRAWVSPEIDYLDACANLPEAK
jgi:WD40 repeat protein